MSYWVAWATARTIATANHYCSDTPCGIHPFSELLGWHICRTEFVRKILFELRNLSREMLRNFPRFFEPLFCGVWKNPANFPPNFPAKNQKKITDELLQARKESELPDFVTLHPCQKQYMCKKVWNSLGDYSCSLRLLPVCLSCHRLLANRRSEYPASPHITPASGGEGASGLRADREREREGEKWGKQKERERERTNRNKAWGDLRWQCRPP